METVFQFQKGLVHQCNKPKTHNLTPRLSYLLRGTFVPIGGHFGDISGTFLQLIAGCLKSPYNGGSFLLCSETFPRYWQVMRGIFLSMHFLPLRGLVHVSGAFLHGRREGKELTPNRRYPAFPDRNGDSVGCQGRPLPNRLPAIHQALAIHCIHALGF